LAAPSPLDTISDEIAAKFSDFQEHPETAAELRADLEQGQPRALAPPTPEPKEIPIKPLKAEEEAAEDERDEVSAEGEGAEQAESDSTQDEAGEEQINTLAELASVYEVDEAELAEHIQIEGPDGEFHSLQEALTAFREGPSESDAASAAVTAHIAESRQAMDAQMAQMVDATKQLLVRIQRDEQIDWNALKQSDPTGYIERREQLDQDRADAQRAFTAFDEEEARRAKENEGLFEERRKDQARLILRRMPKWRDEKLAAAATADMQQYLQSNGFGEDDFNQLIDANQIITVWKAAQFDKLQAKIKKPGAIKRLRGIPSRKSLAATARSEAPAVDAGAQKRQGKVDTLRDSGNEADAAALFAELF